MPFAATFRRDLIIIFTVICLLTIIISLRSVAPDELPQPVGGTRPPAKEPVQAPEPVSNPVESSPVWKAVEPVHYVAPSTNSATSSSVPTPTETAHSAPRGCDAFPDTKDILVVMKTGATEAYDKLPIHFLTTLKCVNDYILFSDMPMNVAGNEVHDTLDEIPNDIKLDNQDFELYSKLQEYYKLREDPRLLKTGTVGWNLDKYKFLPMLRKTWKYRQDAAWYVFIEADTAVMWDNMRTFLDKFDAKKPLYLGSPTYLDMEFAHGGTGYIISQAAMKSAVGNHPNIEDKHGKDVKGLCCGDRMIAAVLKDENIGLTRAWPMLNGEKPLTVPYNEKHWCTPAITMHHLTSQEVSQVWNFEQERKAAGIKTPLIWRDIFYKFANESLVAYRDDWMNLSDDLTLRQQADPEKTYDGKTWNQLSEVQRSSIETADKCKAACDAEPRCMQWMHADLECRLHWSIRQGASKSSEANNKWTSGWQLDRVEKFKTQAGDCSGTLKWDTQGP